MTMTTATAHPATRKEASLWLLDRFVPDSGVNNLSLAFRVRGRLDAGALEGTLRHLLRRYPVLRTVFTDTEGELSKRYLTPEEISVPVERHERPATGIEDRLTTFVARPFRADGGPLLRVLHLTGGEGDICCVAIHHSISDVQSTTLLRDAFVSCYDALAAGSPPPEEAEVPVWTEPEPSADSARFWREQLRGFRSTELELWCEHPEPGETTLAGDEVTHTLSEQAREAVKRLQRQVRAPESVVLLAAYYLLLANHGAGPDLTVGSPVSARSKEAAQAVGYHSNMVTLRVRVEREEGFRQLAGRTRRTFLEAMAHLDFPADELLEVVEREDSSWRNVLFRHAFNYVPYDETQKDFTLAGEPAELLVVENGSSQFDLEFFVTSSARSLQVRGVFYTGVLDRADVELMLQRYEALLIAVEAEPDRPVAELPAWCARDREVITAANANDRPLPYETVPRAVAERVREVPDAVAVRDGERAVSYRQLWAAAVATRDLLTESGIGAGDTVALLARRGPELAAAVLGSWLAGAGYLPLDPQHPLQRITYQLDDSRAGTVIAGGDTAVPGGRKVLPLVTVDTAEPVDLDQAVALAAAAEPEGTAYLMYTSGSTGLPKGIPIRHRSLANVIADYAERFGGTGGASATAWLSTVSFDISAIELLIPLVRGGQVVVAPDEARSEGTAMAELLRDEEIGFVQATPTTWRLVAGEIADLLPGRTVLTGGEPIPAELARDMVEAGATVWNVYGPTESTIWATAGRIPAGVRGRVDVGTPVANTTVFIAGPDGRELPIGLRGELCVAGTGVGPGYHDRAELTAERFGEHETHGRFYRSGDVARWRPDGRLDLLGRMDRQVKLRGNRIELGEVEGVLLTHPGVGAAAVVVVGDPGVDGVLVAFVCLSGGQDVLGTLWDHAHTMLPRSVVPHRFIPVEDFPKTGSGKVDYRELARRAEGELGGEATGAEPEQASGELVTRLLGLWRTLLERTDLDETSHFFAEGGHSLLGAKLAQEIEQGIGVRLKLTDIFEHPTPRALAACIAAHTESDAKEGYAQR
ncbi:non-ribosomal peptide synthetase [Amycolatopsis cihanbeyliensis]|uniref:Amino acid adenylation domain-containing protein n=1 Tax=Amycolatopsis cihanbeyliensis TaxID=1128664 RepID=A0A542DJG3_AMYCI|nr:non-ribosomal peptide synthetase [Amycolatopsis cihanbeyliensis]TQJ03206.1 amino acid adenylation domain-containing protein [Amycolatopsis cihanbeyliensis]WCB87233.1 EfrB [Amycolatopsis cihanbeyliensis]